MDPNLKQRIIDEAYVLFLTKGMKQTSFCDVAAAVHKSKGAVMHYFSSKRHLIDTVVKMRFSRLHSSLRKWITWKGEDGTNFSGPTKIRLNG